jgi:hypothetical protein
MLDSFAAGHRASSFHQLRYATPHYLRQSPQDGEGGIGPLLAAKAPSQKVLAMA